MRYFRDYPWGLQLLLFLLMVYTLMYGALAFVPALITKVTGFTTAQMQGITPSSPRALINAAMAFQGVSSIFMFTLPGLLFAYLSTPRAHAYLGLRSPGKKIQPVLVVFIMLGATPLLMALTGLIGKINFGPNIHAAQEANDNLSNAFLNIHSITGLVKAFFIIALIPALGEELFFRGILMRFVKQRSRNMWIPILFTSAVFAYIHTNINGYIAIFLAGVLLAVIYYVTGSLWCSVLGHLFFNGTQATLSYLSNSNPSVKAFMTDSSIPYYLVVAGAILFGASFYLLIKNKTPLPPNWTDNFTPAELAERTNTL